MLTFLQHIQLKKIQKHTKNFEFNLHEFDENICNNFIVKIRSDKSLSISESD